jgi:hypothetical protein
MNNYRNDYDEPDYDDYNDDYDDDEIDFDDNDDELIDGVGFARDGSALRAETKNNPRIYPCPDCGAKDVLTAIDVQRHYCCDRCANRKERGFDY